MKIIGYSGDADPHDLLLIGGICSIAGFVLFWKVFQGDTMLPGALFTRIPNWMFWSGGLLLQIPLALAFWFLKKQGLL